MKSTPAFISYCCFCASVAAQLDEFDEMPLFSANNLRFD